MQDLELSVEHLRRNKLGLVALIGMLPNETGEEKYLQDGKHDEKLDENNGPERAPKRHVAESIIIEMEHFVEEVGLRHKQ
jgi:hypothetical protein